MTGAQHQLVRTLTHLGVDHHTATRFAEQTIIGPNCWHWTGNLNGRRFARFYYDGNQSGVYAHTWLYTVLYGQPRPGERLIRTCHNPWCVAPRHIREASHGGAIAHGKAMKRRRHLEGV